MALKIKVMNHLTKFQGDVCLLQETNLTDSRGTDLKSSRFLEIFLANYNSRQRGVAILVNNGFGDSWRLKHTGKREYP